MQINKTTVEVVHGGVVEQDVEAIVNAANTAMRGGGGVDGVIHRAAGRGLMDELRKVAPNGAKTGSAVLTGGHNLKQPYILHTPGPVWKGGANHEPDKLASCYRSCLELADKKGLQSIAFCSIATGIYSYPLDQAAPLAVRTVAEYLTAHPDTSLTRVVFAMYQQGEFTIFSKALDELNETHDETDPDAGQAGVGESV